MGVSGWQIAIIVLVIVLLFGGKKIPELAKGMGSGIKNFKKAMKEDEEEITPKNVEDKTNETIKSAQTQQEEKQA
ncbi:twin-arginine translocase TatA/TatE family subunit [Helicobacter cholecystus]|uniref:Sec-independent protein translocase protein TatA n=1 Tax=Helicobacter cholecystus TaxID=45498 RepID=A0A3D8IUQ0_9HELI|nr:twin-arginine translocase TatA/TatE family subunit [Helicobacter cholecystus]RDU68696.1 twin-arginine translocase TatA/TatE family subunit [Helicobacter cholecystus]VEJ26147.1 twin-arginine translocation protein TatA [Helicobacter cholecystus]